MFIILLIPMVSFCCLNPREEVEKYHTKTQNLCNLIASHIKSINLRQETYQNDASLLQKDQNLLMEYRVQLLQENCELWKAQWIEKREKKRNKLIPLTLLTTSSIMPFLWYISTKNVDPIPMSISALQTLFGMGVHAWVILKQGNEQHIYDRETAPLINKVIKELTLIDVSKNADNLLNEVQSKLSLPGHSFSSEIQKKQISQYVHLIKTSEEMIMNALNSTILAIQNV